MHRFQPVCLFVLLVILLSGCQSLTPVQTTLPDIQHIDKYGGLWFELSSGDFQTKGYRLADIVQLDIAGKSFEMPVVPSYRYVKSGEPALVLAKDGERPLGTTIFYGDAATRWGIASKSVGADKRMAWALQPGVSLPLPVTIKLVKKGGYADRLSIFDLQRTNDRGDYARLTDWAFANFRAVHAGRIADGVLYRSSSPINPAIGRSVYADQAARSVGVKTIMNMVDTEAQAKAMPDYGKSYSATCPTVFLPLGVDVSQKSFADGVREGLRFLLAHETPYLMHCKEGQDRTGFLCAVLELWQGASLQEATADYLLTFGNFYGVKPASRQGRAIAENLHDNLKTVFGLKSLANANLAEAARAYLLNTGLTVGELDALQRKLRP